MIGEAFAPQKTKCTATIQRCIGLANVPKRQDRMAVSGTSGEVFFILSVCPIRVPLRVSRIVSGNGNIRLMKGKQRQISENMIEAVKGNKPRTRLSADTDTDRC